MEAKEPGLTGIGTGIGIGRRTLPIRHIYRQRNRHALQLAFAVHNVIRHVCPERVYSPLLPCRARCTTMSRSG